MILVLELFLCRETHHLTLLLSHKICYKRDYSGVSLNVDSFRNILLSVVLNATVSGTCFNPLFKPLYVFLVLSDGPAVQDGGRTASLCALHQTQQRSPSQQV